MFNLDRFIQVCAVSIASAIAFAVLMACHSGSVCLIAVSVVPLIALALCWQLLRQTKRRVSCLKETQSGKQQTAMRLVVGLGYSAIFVPNVCLIGLYVAVAAGISGHYEIAERIYSIGNLVIPNPNGCTITAAFPPSERQGIIGALASIDKVYGSASPEHKHFIAVLNAKKVQKDSCG